AVTATLAEKYSIQLTNLIDYKKQAIAEDRAVPKLALGSEACEYVAEEPGESVVLCALVSAASLGVIRESNPGRNIQAVVVDQPSSRQIAAAHWTYPELKRFSVLTLDEESNPAASDGTSVLRFGYRSDISLSSQISNAIEHTDALVALPEHAIFNSSSLRTVLLIAYGYAKPVIGYSRSYVKAGALITTYSTPMHIMRQVFELWPELIVEDTALVNYPKYFSIEHNSSVARSLGLTKRAALKQSVDYMDKDLLP
ncbi:MAG: hypothetical protein KAG66_15550, partial [Methylococcales bacterium]|nr:hypothetical protein [Methylococcales bacterium]